MDRVRISDVFVTGFNKSNHDIRFDYSIDYAKSTSTFLKTFDSLANNIEPEVLQFQPAKESVKSMLVKISTVSPTGSGATAINSGTQLELHGITVRLGLKMGGAMLPVAQKG